MLTKAYIQEVLSPHSVKIRMPLYNKIANVSGATPNKELAVACVCSLPNFVTNVNVGDIVIVGFEEEMISKPVILGYLSMSGERYSLTDVICNQLTTRGDTHLDEHTHIGEVEPESIKCLKGLTSNINTTFTQTSQDISSIKDTIVGIQDDVLSNSNSIVQIKETDISKLEDSIGTLSNRISILETNYESLLNKFNDYLMKYPTILGSGTYGDTLPDSAAPGQVYFTLKPGE